MYKNTVQLQEFKSLKHASALARNNLVLRTSKCASLNNFGIGISCTIIFNLRLRKAKSSVALQPSFCPSLINCSFFDSGFHCVCCRRKTKGCHSSPAPVCSRSLSCCSFSIVPLELPICWAPPLLLTFHL